MSKVFIVQENPKANYMPAGRYGELETLLPPGDQIVFNAQPVVWKIKEKLRHFSDDDFILASGDPAAIGIACAVAAERNEGRVKILKWDRRAMCYYDVQIDLRKGLTG